MPKISLITPVYNVENYLPKCLDSILNQTFSDFEVFVVDDGSTDSSGAIADRYAKKDPRIKVIHKENGGAPSARNAGIEKATGDYLYFPDSDDWLSSDYLEDLYSTAVKTGADLVISGYTMEYYESNKRQTYKVTTKDRFFDGKNTVRNNLHGYFDNMMMAVPWNKLYSAKHIKDNNLRFPDLKWDDLHFNMEVVRDINSVAISSSSGYHFFRSRPGSETTKVFDGMLFHKRKEQFKHILSVYKYWGVRSKAIIETIYGYYAARLVQCIQEIASSDVPDKERRIKKILDDDLSKKALRYGKINSGILRIAAIPMRMGSVKGCLVIGKMMGFVKNNMAAFFYKLKSKSVNKAS